MKHIRFYTGLVLLLISTTIFAQQHRPDWVENRPSGMMDYIGIATASKSLTDYKEVAKRAAMSELISQIEVKVSSNSLMNISEKDDSELSSYFSETVKTSTSKRLENLQLYDTWEDEDNYWVMYRLDKDEYAEQVKKAIALVTKKGSELWQNGESALQQGNLMTAADFFMQGLSVIEPYANEDLRYEFDKQYSLGNILLTSFRTLFQGIEVKAYPSEIEIASFKGEPFTIHVKVTRQQQALSNIKLKGEFVNGSGIISPIPSTDLQGNTHFDIQNVTSKNANQSLCIILDTKNFVRTTNASYMALIKSLNKNIPSCLVKLQARENSTLSAYIKTSQEDDATLKRSLKSFVNVKYFDITETPNNADVIIKLMAKYEKGGIVKGDAYNLKEYFTTINISFIDNRTNKELTSYTLDSKRTLVPAKASEATARNAALREAMKVVKKQLPEYIKNLKINTEGDIPSHDEPEETPFVDVYEKPVIEEVTQPKPQLEPEDKYIEGEIEENVFIRYVGKKDFDSKTIFKFVIINKRKDDYNLNIYNYNIKLVDNSGNEVKTKIIRLGSKASNYNVNHVIVPEVNTSLELETPVTEALALFSLKVYNNNVENEVKLRKLNY